ncbi:myotubularin-related protein 10-B-like [Artemia franciscana]|uniref:Myotubularin phosphatase domain-containing protein n=1 Tax=Artemia franciscana TaxID=6661 RepID=A0AA88I8D7_ARTSF|nr:hypothetical protein QYM36_003903 [Artemia franciscana]
MESFKSYIIIDDAESDVNSFERIEDARCVQLEPRLLPGETVIALAPHVLKFSPLCERKHGVSGDLFITNFKISFVTPQDAADTDGITERNQLLSSYDICLMNVDRIYSLHSGGRRKLLVPGSNLTGAVRELQILCKDLSSHLFGFKFVPNGAERAIVNAMLHHCYPKRVELHFAFECRLPATQDVPGVSMFRQAQDWDEELRRCHSSTGWRICYANENYQICPSLSEVIVVSSDLTDDDIAKASASFRGNRPPIWCWGHKSGCVIVRMSTVSADSSPSSNAVIDRKQENEKVESIMLENIRKAHSRRKQPLILELDTLLPPVKEVQNSFVKLRDLICVPPDSMRILWDQDDRFLSQLESTRWLHMVSSCLRLASTVSRVIMDQKVSVVLQESSGRDWSAIISSLAQILLDSHCRTIQGFHSLVQKEWVALGHPFSTRLGRWTVSDGEQSPLFNLFLDCVWQILQQFPAQFEFTSTYLITIWDSMHLSVFDTFLFDSPRDRKCAVLDNQTPLTSRSVWDWSLQYDENEQELFYNPLYPISKRVVETRQSLGLPPTDPTPAPPASQLTSQLAQTLMTSSLNLGYPNVRTRSGSISSLNRHSSYLEDLKLDGTETLNRSWMKAGSRSSLFGAGWNKIKGVAFGTSPRPSRILEEYEKSMLEGEIIDAMGTLKAGTVSTRNSVKDAFTPPSITPRHKNGGTNRWTVCDGQSLGQSRRSLQQSEDELRNVPVPWHKIDWSVYTVLPVMPLVANLKFWAQCYARFFPVFDIRGGGDLTNFCQNWGYVDELMMLENTIASLEAELNYYNQKSPKSRSGSISRRVSSSNSSIRARTPTPIQEEAVDYSSNPSLILLRQKPLSSLSAFYPFTSQRVLNDKGSHIRSSAEFDLRVKPEEEHYEGDFIVIS